MQSHSTWESVGLGVFRFRDSCNVYFVASPAGGLVINAGTGAWIDHLDELPSQPTALACTHYFRDHSAGARRAAIDGRLGVYVPEGERAIFEDPAEHFRRRETFIVYDNVWDLFAPIAPTPVAGVLRDYERLTLGGLEIEIIPQPGATVTQVGLLIKLPSTGKRVLFTGETIHSPGRIPRVAPLQYNYNDLGGATNVFLSAELLRKTHAEAIFPSLGEPIVADVDSALVQLKQTLRRIVRDRPGMTENFDRLDNETLTRVTDHVWKSEASVANTWFVLSDSGKVMAIDYGYNQTIGSGGFPNYPKPHHRRAMLHSLDALKKQLGRDRIDVVLLSHFHDDHVCGVPGIQRVMGTQCWAPDAFADLIEHPEAHCFPCNWPTKMRVDQRLKMDEPFTWEEYTFHLAPMNGHTRFAALIGFEADGKRFAHTGDQYFFQNGVEQFSDNKVLQNHVYRNGALLDGYDLSGDWMLKWRPDVVIQGHQPAMWTDENFFKLVGDWTTEYRAIHQAIMPLGDEDVHFNLDSWGGWIWPYRVNVGAAGERATVRVTVRNPLPREATVEVRLVGLDGWKGSSASLKAKGREEVSCEMTITPNCVCRSQPFAVELSVEGRPFGQVAEGLMSVG